MNYEEFKSEIIKFFKEINNIAIIEYEDKLPTEKLNKLKFFDESNIIFNDTTTSITDNGKLYINCNYFKENNLYSKEKFDATKNQFMQKYLEKFIVFDYNHDRDEALTKYVCELECNKIIQKYNLPIDTTNNYTNEYILTLIANKTGINYTKLICDGNVNKLLDSLGDENLKQEYLKKFKNQENKQNEDKNELEQIAQTYGVDLTDIEEISIKNKNFYKIKKNNTYNMIEANSKLSMLDEFKSYQEESSLSQSLDSKKNSEEIVDNMKGKKIEINLIPITDLPRYKGIIDNLTIEQKNCISLLIANKDKLQIELIDIKYGMAIDKQGKCVFAEKNYDTGEYKIKAAKTTNYDEKETKNVSDNNSDVNQTTENVENSMNNDANDENQTFEDTTNEKEEKQSEKEISHQKVLTLRKPFANGNGFVNVLVLALITGFTSGMILGILFLLIK